MINITPQSISLSIVNEFYTFHIENELLWF